jgi:hypothetical protein
LTSIGDFRMEFFSSSKITTLSLQPSTESVVVGWLRRLIGYIRILRLEGVSAIPWIQPFLATADDNAAEAALAIAGTHSPEGFNILRECFLRSSDPWWRSVLPSAITLTRQDAALEFLLDLVSGESLMRRPRSRPFYAPCPLRRLSSAWEWIGSHPCR